MPARVARPSSTSFLNQSQTSKVTVMPVRDCVVEVNGFAKLELLTGATPFGNRYHKEGTKLWAVASGFGVLYSQRVSAQGVRAEPMSCDALYPNSVITVEPFTAYAMSFDVSAVLYGSTIAQNVHAHTLVGTLDPTARAEMTLQAMTEYARGVAGYYGHVQTNAYFEFGDGKTVCLNRKNQTVTYNNMNFTVNNQNIVQILGGVRRYLGI